MHAVLLAVTIAAIVANATIAVADFVPARFVLDNSAAVRVPRSWLPALGAAKGAGAAGLGLGLLGVRAIGVAAAVGLVAFFVGAVVTHVRARNFSLAFPVAYLALALGSLVGFVVR